MHRVWIVVFVVATSLLTACASSEPPPVADVDHFSALEKRWMDALAAKDVHTLEELLAPEFSIIGAGSTADRRTASRASWLEVGLKRPFPRHNITDVRVTLLGAAAVVQLNLTGDYPPNSLTIEGGTVTFLITDVWVNRAGKWQVVSRHSSLPGKR
jgi:hypothetical protein